MLHIQIYGWINPGGNVSSAKTGYGANAPAAYAFTPNIVQLDQAVVYVERVPDTVQMDHIDWGFRVSGLYGENYRYTTAYGHLGAGHRGAARTEQLYVFALDDLCVRQLHDHRSPDHAQAGQELGAAVRFGISAGTETVPWNASRSSIHSPAIPAIKAREILAHSRPTPAACNITATRPGITFTSAPMP